MPYSFVSRCKVGRGRTNKAVRGNDEIADGCSPTLGFPAVHTREDIVSLASTVGSIQEHKFPLIWWSYLVSESINSSRRFRDMSLFTTVTLKDETHWRRIFRPVFSQDRRTERGAITSAFRIGPALIKPPR